MVRTIMFSTTSYLFGRPKRTTPHDFRRIAITWQRKYGVVEDQEGLAEIMGHSVEYANKIYNQMTSGEKAKAASEWWLHTRSTLPFTADAADRVS
jgi:integrase